MVNNNLLELSNDEGFKQLDKSIPIFMDFWAPWIEAEKFQNHLR
nr:4516_t:CDS:2 [Entrophospora candida]